jgi:hypothetical protein
VTLSAYEEQVFALIVANVEADRRWHRARRLFLALGALMVALALLLLPRHAGWAPTVAFVGSYAGGAVVVLVKGPRLFRRGARALQ